MARMRRKERIRCRHFAWVLFQRNLVWYADGRGSSPNLGKQSLGTRDWDEAIANLAKLDHHMAVRHGLAEPEVNGHGADLTIAEGWSRFLESGSIPQELGGWAPATHLRYASTRKVVEEFCAGRSIERWSQFDKRIIDEFSSSRHRGGRAPRTIKTDLEAIRSLNRWLVREGHLAPSFRLNLKIPKMHNSDTYCYTPEEVQAIYEHTRTSGRRWLADVVITLAMSGLRIGELLELRCSDIDLDHENPTIHVRDDRFAKRGGDERGRRTKGGESRHVPVCPQLRPVLAAIPSQDGHILRGPDGGPLRYHQVLTTFKRDVLRPLADRFPAS